MRICLVSQVYPPIGYGGIAAYTRVLARGLVAAGQDVTVISTSVSGQDEEIRDGPEREYRVSPGRLPMPGGLRRKGEGIWKLLERSWAVDRAVGRLERREGPFDIVEMPNWGAEALVYGLRPRVPLVVRLSTSLSTVARVRGMDTGRVGFRLHAGMEALPVRRAQQLIAHSHYIAAHSADLYGVPRERIQVVPLGIEEDEEEDEYAPEPHDATGPDAPVRFLFVGRLERRKGIHLLLEAIPRVVAAQPNAHFTVVGDETGDGPEGLSYQEFFSRLADARSRAQTCFTGYLEAAELERIYRGCDVFVAPSLSESFGLIWVEAMARARPVVALRAGAAPEVVVEEETGLLVEAGDVAGLADALIRLARSPEMRESMGAAGYRRMQETFSREAMVQRTLTCYQDVARKRGDRG